jgi:hypothetical protein
MARTLWIVGGLATLALSACSRSDVIHDKDYFAAHDAERGSIVTACQKNPGEEAGDANCINAAAAQADVDRKKFYQITPPASRQSDPGKL